MLCAIYKSVKKAEMYLFVAKRDDFSAVPDALRAQFGTPQFVMLFNLAGDKQLQRVANHDVEQAIQTQGFYLQMPPPPENLHKAFVAAQQRAI